MPRKKLDENISKQRLLNAAIKTFAIHGYEGASTRQIAKEADVNISAILYYFEGKEGLYHAAMEQLAALMKEGIADQAKMIATVFTNPNLANPKLNDTIYRELLHQFMRGAMRFMLSDKVSPYAVQIFMREQAEPTQVFEIFYRVMEPVQQTLKQLIEKLTGLDPQSEALTICVHAILGQITIFRTHREVILRATGWKKFDDSSIEKVATTVLLHTDAIIAHYRKAGGI